MLNHLNNKTMRELQEKIFKEKAETYTVCYNQQCPLHEHCLHYDVGPFVQRWQRVVPAVSPYYEHSSDGQCDLFKDNKPVKMMVGMKKHFYFDMPARIASSIKNRLINHTCRATYYKYHNGKLPIPPQLLSYIEKVSREAGWTQPLVFDDEVEGYAW